MESENNEKTVMLREIGMQADFVHDNIDGMLGFMRDVLADRDPGTLEHGFMIGCGDSYCAALAARNFMVKATGRMSSRSRRWSSRVTSSRTCRRIRSSSASPIRERSRERSKACGSPASAAPGRSPSQSMPAAGSRKRPRRYQGQRRRQHQGAARRNARRHAGHRHLHREHARPFHRRHRARRAAGHARRRAIRATRRLAEERRRIAWPLPTRARAGSPRSIAPSFTPDRKTVILGGGPNFATAYFGMAKWLEALTRPCHASELEEWAHEEYFITDEQTDTFVLLPPGSGHSRGLEQARAAREMGSRVIIVGEAGDAAARSRRRRLFPDAGGDSGVSDALRLQGAVRISLLRNLARAEHAVPRLPQSEAPAGQFPPDLQLGPGRREARRRLMDTLLSTIRAGRKPVIGMVQLGPLRRARAIAARRFDRILDCRAVGGQDPRRQRRRRADGPESRRPAGGARGDARTGRLDDAGHERGPRSLRAAGRAEPSGERRGGDDRRRLRRGRRFRPDQGLCRRDDDAVRHRERQGARGDQGAQRSAAPTMSRSSPTSTIVPARRSPAAASPRMSSSRSASAAPTDWC